MVSGRLKSNSLKKKSIKTLKGNNNIHYKKGIRNLPKCAITKKPLRGIPKLNNRKFKNLNLSQKRVSRPFGGYMSHIALRKKVIDELIE